MKRCLIVTADDFGFSAERNKGVMESFANSAVMSTSLLLNCTGTEEGVQLLKDAPSLCPGLHLNLTEGRPVSRDGSYETLTDPSGIFWGKDGLREQLKSGSVNMAEIRREIDAQIARYKELFGATPVYVDGHQHIHVHPAVVEIFADALKQHGIQVTRFPLEVNLTSKKWVSPELMSFLAELLEKAERYKVKEILNSRGIRTTDGFTGLSTMGSDMTLERLQHIILESFTTVEANLSGQPRDITTVELMTHPGYPTGREFGGFCWGTDEFGRSTDRVHEIQVLSSQEMKEFYRQNNIELISHRELCD